MKKVIALLILALSFPVYAEVKDFDFLAVDVPKGWTATQQGTSMVVIKSNKSKSSLSLALSSKGNASIKEIAERLYTQLNGFEMEEDDEGDYSFYYVDKAGLENFVYVVDGDDEQYILSSSYAANERDGDIIDEMIDSAEFALADDEEEEYDDDYDYEDEDQYPDTGNNPSPRFHSLILVDDDDD